MKEQLFRMAGQFLLSQDAKEDRWVIRDRVIFWLAVFFIVAPLLYWMKPAKAEESKPTLVAEVGENRLFLFHDECPLGGWFATWKRAEWFYEGKTYAACWKAARAETGVYVHTVDADGEPGAVPLSMFRRQEGV